MDHQPRLERLLIGLRGLGLLRAWPLGDSGEAEIQLAAIAEMLAHRDGPPMNEVLELREYDHADGYAAWSETYDEPGNALIDVEERALRPILATLPVGDAADIACGTGRPQLDRCRRSCPRRRQPARSRGLVSSARSSTSIRARCRARRRSRTMRRSRWRGRTRGAPSHSFIGGPSRCADVSARIDQLS